MASSQTLSIEQVAALRVLARKRAQQNRRIPSFLDFLAHCSIRSDDPLNPQMIPLVPWPFQLERAEAWAGGASEVILKERQLGFSAALVAPYMLWRAMFYGWSCGYLSVGQLEAREEISRIRALYGTLAAEYRVPGTIRVDDATFEGGGRIIAYPSTEHAGISYTLQLVVMDEAAFHPYGGANYAAIQPAVSRGQMLILSTASPELGASGFFHDMYWASKRGETPYRAVFEARRRPDRDEAWYARMRLAYAGREDMADAYYPETDAAAFVGRSGLVYPMFDPRLHVVPAHPHPWQQTKMRLAGVDFGGGDPTVVSVVGMAPSGGIHQYAEFYQRGAVTIEEIGAFLVVWHQLRPFASIECDPSQTTAIASLAAKGLPAVAADNAREAIGLTASLLAQRRLTIHADCKGSIAEFAGYRWAERVDPHDRERYATKTPVDHHGDGMDARRYALKRMIDWEESLAPTFVNLSGRPLRRKAV